MSNTTSIICSNCGEPIDEPSSVLLPMRAPCRGCGSTRRTFTLDVAETVKIREKIGLKHRRPGHKRAIYESVEGYDLHRYTGQWSHLSRVIDRENNRYQERIINPATREVLRSVDEPLTDHVGRGTARKKTAS